MVDPDTGIVTNMRRFEYARIHLDGDPFSIGYDTEASWFAGLEQSTVDAILATATESTTPRNNLRPPRPPHMRLWPLDVLNVVGAAGWRAYQLERPANGGSGETHHLIREVGD